MIISIVFATTMVAGIAISLTLSGLYKTVISSAEQFENRKIAVLKHSPCIDFVKDYRGRVILIDKLEQMYKLLRNKEVAAVVFDRPQIKYFLEKHPDDSLIQSDIEYHKQGYGFVFPLNSKLTSMLNVDLLRIKEEGMLKVIEGNWLGTEKNK